MSNFIFILKDESVKIKSNFDKFLHKNYQMIKYLLIPINDHSFIMHKPKEYMKTFHHGKVEFQMCIMHDDIISYLLELTSKELSSIVDLFQYIHSLNRIIYCNKLANCSESPCYERTEFVYFNITLYDKANQEIYSCKMDLKTEKGQFGPIEILDKITDIYKPTKKFGDSFLYVDDKWGFSNYPTDKYRVYGVLHPYTKSISFYQTPILQKLLNSIKTCYFCVSTYNPSVVSDDECEDKSMEFSTGFLNGPDYHWAIRIMDYWTNDISSYLEFIEYSYYIRDNAKFVSELNDYNEFKDIYKTTVTYEIELLTTKNNYRFLKRYVNFDDTFSLSDVLRQI